MARALGAALLVCILAPLAGRAAVDEHPTFVKAFGAQGRLGSFNEPIGVAHESGETGDFLFVVDSGNARVQVLSLSGEVIGAFGQRGADPAGFWQPIDIAVAPSGGHLYVVDRRHRLVQEFDPSPRCLEGRARCFVRAWGGWGTGPGQFQDPMGIDVDRGGRVYVADWGAHVVQVFDAEGVPIRTIGRVGIGRGELMHPTDVAVSDDGSVWVADRDNDRLSVFDQDGNFVTSHSFGDRLHYPVGIDFGVDGSFAVADYEPGYGQPRVRLFTPERKMLRETVLGGDGRKGDYPPMGVAVLPRQSVLVTAPCGPHSGLALVPVEGDVSWLGERGRALDQFSFPSSVAVDPLFVAVVDTGNARVIVLGPEGGEKLIGVMGGELAPQFGFADPRGIAVWRSGPQMDDAVVLIADPLRNMVFRGTPTGRMLDAWGTGEATESVDGFRHPLDVAVGPGGIAYIADTGNDRIVRRGPDGEVLGTIGPFVDGEVELMKPSAVTIGPGGYVYVLEQARSRLQAFGADGSFVGIWSDAGDARSVGAGQLWMPVDLAADGDYLYVLENETVQQGNAEHVRVQVFEPRPGVPLSDCLIAVFGDRQGASESQVWNPRGIAAGNDWVAVADSGNNRVQLFRWIEEGIAPPPLLPTRTPQPSPTPTEPPPTATATAVPTEEPRPTDMPPTATAAMPSPTASGATQEAPLPTPDRPTDPVPSATDVPTVEPTPSASAVGPTATPTLATPYAERQPRPTGRVNYLPIAVR